TKLGNPLKGYVGVIKDVLRGQDTVSGLKVVVQLVHLNPSSPFKTTVVDYAKPRNVLFWPSKAYMKSARRPFRPPPQAPMPRESTSGGATPMPEMPDRTSFLTPAWDPSSCTPRYSHSYFGRPKLTAYKIYRTVDPSSLTPAWNPEDQPPATDGQIASDQPDQPQHPLLDV